MRIKAVILLSAIVFFLALGLYGVVPRKLELQGKDDFLRGKFSGVSLSFEGILSLSPKEERVEAPAEDFFLSLLIAPRGVLYLGTGHMGKIFRINPDGKAELFYTTTEMDVTCLALDRKGNLYAGTSPNGKIYKITDREKGTIFFNPDEKYIWDLLFAENDTLMAAVGEAGGIYEINKEGEGRKLFSAEENHILCLKKDAKGNIIAGSGGGGLLYRISQHGKASVLFESPYEEIKSLVFDDEGNIYAAAGGMLTKPREDRTPIALPSVETDVTITVTPESSAVPKIFATDKKHPGALFRVNEEGMAKQIWSSPENLVYTLLWSSADKKLFFGTGNQGRVFSVDKNEKISLMFEKDSEQVYGLYSDDAKVYMVSNNPSGLSTIFPEQRFSGEYLSQVFDTRTISSWGRIGWMGELPSGTTLQFQTRSGNSREPGDTWSDWSPPYQKQEGEMILSPRARYLQFKVMFKTQSGKISPRLSKIHFFYLQTNIAPLVTKLDLLPPNQVFLKPPEREEVIWGLEEETGKQTETREEARSYVVMKKVERKGYQTATWEAADENGDRLLFSVLIKSEGDQRWRILREQLSEKLFTFDTLSFPDGVYYLKVVASDAPSNPQGMELQAEKESQPLVIDNSLPLIKNFQVIKDKNRLSITFEVEDSFSDIEEVQYLIRPDGWQTVFPVDGICDSRKESFKLTVGIKPNSDTLITVKVKDSHQNIGVFRQAF